MAIEAERLLAIFEARFTSLEKALAKARGDASRAFGDIEASGSKAETALARIGSKGTPGIDRAARSVRGVRLETGNLAAQFNDIAVQLAGGQSPFLIAIQQGTQITQALGPAGARGAATALGGAFMSMLNPVSLATFAIIGLGGTAVQYFTSFLEFGEDSEETLKAQAALIQAVADQWGDALPALRAYADERDRLKDESDIQQAVELTIQGNFEKIREQIPELTADYAELVNQLMTVGAKPEVISAVQKEFDELTKSIADGSATTKDLKEFQAALDTAFTSTSLPAASKMAKTIGGLADEMARAAENTAELRKQEAARTTPAIYDPRDSRYTNPALPGSAPTPDRRVDPYFDANPTSSQEYLAAQLLDAGRSEFDKKVDGETERIVKSAEAVGIALDEAAARITATEVVRRDMAASTVGTVADLIKNFEGFRSEPYWDVNAYRAGFGSDTVTLSDGTIQAVTRGITVTLADAERDLARRIGEFQDGIRGKIGGGTFDAMNEKQQAALTSIAYNYGSLPDRIVAAIRGGKAQEVYGAIKNLGNDNGGVNRGRRSQEADVYLGASGPVAQTAVKEITAEADARKKREATIKATVDALLSEAEATNIEREGLAQSVYERERAAQIQESINNLKRQGIELTKEEYAAVVAAAEGRALEAARLKESEDAAKSFAEAQKLLAKQQDEFNDAIQGAARGFVQDLIEGKSAAEALSNALGKIADKALDLAFDNIFGGAGAGGGGGLFGALFGGGLFRERGGPVRRGQPYIVGEKRPEVFVPETNGRILSRVPPAPTMTGGRGGGEQSIRVYVEAVEGDMFRPVVRAEAQGVSVQVSQSSLGRYDKALDKTFGSRMARAQGRQI